MMSFFQEVVSKNKQIHMNQKEFGPIGNSSDIYRGEGGKEGKSKESSEQQRAEKECGPKANELK